MNEEVREKISEEIFTNCFLTLHTSSHYTPMYTEKEFEQVLSQEIFEYWDEYFESISYHEVASVFNSEEVSVNIGSTTSQPDNLIVEISAETVKEYMLLQWKEKLQIFSILSEITQTDYEGYTGEIPKDIAHVIEGDVPIDITKEEVLNLKEWYDSNISSV